MRNFKLKIKPSTIKWHLQRDSCVQLAKFCDKWQVDRKVSDYYQAENDNDNTYFTLTTFFGNGGWIEAELKQGSSIAECYAVVDYRLGK